MDVAALLAEWQAGIDSLDPERSPCAGLPGATWPEVHAGMRAFLVEHGPRAADLGWDARRLFGVHRLAGALRGDSTGALITNKAYQVVAIDAATITLARDVTRLVFRGLTNPGESVPVWMFGRG